MKTHAGRVIPTTTAEVCDPRTSALLIYDMQAGVVSQLPDGATIIARIAALLDAAREAGLRVFFMRHGWLPNRYAGAGQMRRAMIWQHKEDPGETRAPFTLGSEGWHIVPALTPRADEVVIDKITMSCFEGTCLNVALRDAGLTSFLIAGIALEVGIEPSVRHALDLNYVPLVVSDACGSANDAARLRSFQTLAYTGEVLTADVDEVVRCMRESAAAP
jgi:biuret amidohydrolase